MQHTILTGVFLETPSLSLIKYEQKTIPICRSIIKCHNRNSDFCCFIFCTNTIAKAIQDFCKKDDYVVFHGYFTNYTYTDVNGTKHHTNYFRVTFMEKNNILTQKRKSIDANNTFISAAISNEEDALITSLLSDQICSPIVESYYDKYYMEFKK